MLDKKIANEIVQKIKPSVDYNINIMDECGMIIASSDKTRIGQIHEIATIALQRNEIIEINKVDSVKFSGTKEGINLPLDFFNNIIGAIGITGDPDQVRNVSELVKITAKSILESNYLLTKTTENINVRNSFLLNLLSGNDVNEYLLMKYKNHFKYYSVNIIYVKTQSINFKQLYEIFKSCDVKLFTLINHNRICFITNTTNNNLINLIKTNFSNEFYIANGKFYDDIIHVQKSYESALHTLNCMIAQNMHNCIRSAQNLLPRLVVYSYRNNSWLYEEFYNIWKDLLSKDKNSSLVNSLLSYYNNNCKIIQTAELLNIHRNTLLYRLEKIYSITKYNPNNIEELFILINAHAIYNHYNYTNA